MGCGTLRGVDHLRLLHDVTGAFEARLASTPHDARLVAARWTVHDLACHLGAVHRWAAANTATTSRTPRTNVPAIDVPLVQWYASSRRVLLDRLDAADPGQRCYTLQRADRTVGFWHRRQLHETLVHLWDLRSATDPAAPPPPEAPPQAHADTIVELFDVFVPRGEPLPLPGPLTLHATDLDAAWTVAPDWTLTETHGNGAATVRGTAGALALFTWNRLPADDARLTVDGAQDVVDTFTRARVRA